METEVRDFNGRAWWQWPTAVLLGLVLALQQALAADVTPPKLESWKQWPDEINVTDGFRRVYVEFRVTDDESGIKTPSITANSSSTSQSSGFGGISVIESSENGLDITFRGEVQIPQGSAPGAWSITLFPLEDEQGNSGSFGPMGFNSGFTVIENSAPAASTLSMNLEPVAGLVHMGVGNLRGCAVSSAGVRSVKAYLDGELLAEIPYGGTRGDVASAFPDIEGSGLSGFSMSLNYSGLTAGSHTLEVITESVDNKTVSQTA